jgi:ABC-2 type transport system permease protein
MMLVYWNLLLLPLFITLEAALITQLEHGRKNWKLLFTTPLPRWSIYAAKLLIVLAWIGLSDLVLLGFMLACGGILQWIYPPFQLNAPFPWGEVLPLLGLSYVSAWFMISFHTWVGTRWSSFVVAMSAGIAATIVSLFIFGEDVANYFPWSIPGVLSLEAGANVDVAACLIIGLAGGVLVALLGGWDIVRKDVI